MDFALFLHTPDSESELSSYYQKAFGNAVEIYIVTAYLTDWNEKLTLSRKCKSFRVIIGKDFGITRKAACTALLKWLPPERKGQFLVADGIGGFHPKAMFWKDAKQNCFALIGSSNLTRAAFETNHEANVYCQISSTEFENAKQWVKGIERKSITVSEDWLARYREAPCSGGKGRSTSPRGHASPPVSPTVAFKLPKPKGMAKLLDERRQQLERFSENCAELEKLFRRCAAGKITPADFYAGLHDYWSSDIGDRLQGHGWEILGKHSDFRELSQSVLRVIDAPEEDRDDIVVEEIDRLAALEIPTRGAFFSEMLCLRFPSEYPLLNDPVHNYVKSIGVKSPNKASEGVRYIDLARKLRFSLEQNPEYPAQNLAELDTIIWAVYGKR